MNFENMHGKIEVIPFDSYGWDNSITFAAATTCYQSETTTAKTAEDFVRMFKRGNHRTPLEFSWYVISIMTDKDPTFLWEYIYTLTQYLRMEVDYADRRIVISGNGRAFMEFIEKADASKVRYYNPARLSFVGSLKKVLHDVNPILFEEKGIDSESWDMVCLPKAVVEDNYDPMHRWQAVRIKNASIGMSRELNRHRTFSINERSTRYTGAGKDSVIRLSHNFGPTITDDAGMYSTFDTIKNDFNKSNDISRQALPLATCTEEVVADRLIGWQHFIGLRKASNAHYEIRDVASKIKNILG